MSRFASALRTSLATLAFGLVATSAQADEAPYCDYWFAPLPLGCVQRVQWIKPDEMVNLANITGQLVQSDHILMTNGGEAPKCYDEALRRATAAGPSISAYYYYHNDSDFLGMVQGDGHCYVWIWDRRADRLSPLASVLFGTLGASANQLPAVGGLVNQLPPIADARRKLDGLEFKKFSSSFTESADVCVKKAFGWQAENRAAWVIPSPVTISVCLAIRSKESFARSTSVSSPITVTPPLPHVAPQSVDAVAALRSAGVITVTWAENGRRVDRYEVEQSPGCVEGATGCTWKPAASLPVDARGYTFNGLTPSAIYGYRVCSVSGSSRLCSANVSERPYGEYVPPKPIPRCRAGWVRCDDLTCQPRASMCDYVAPTGP